MCNFIRPINKEIFITYINVFFIDQLTVKVAIFIITLAVLMNNENVQRLKHLSDPVHCRTYRVLCVWATFESGEN